MLLEENKEKIQKICAILETETLEPAKKEAATMIEAARQEALSIIEEGRKQSQALIVEAKKTIEQKETAFKNQMKHSVQQTIATLKQLIQKHVLNPGLLEWAQRNTTDESAAHILQQLIPLLTTENTDFSVLLGEQHHREAILKALATNLINTLKQHPITVGHFKKGIQIRLDQQNLIIDVSDEALYTLLERYIRKDMRDIFFTAS